MADFLLAFIRVSRVPDKSHGVGSKWECPLLPVASLLLLAMPGASSSFLFPVVRPGAPNSVLVPSRIGWGSSVIRMGSGSCIDSEMWFAARLGEVPRYGALFWGGSNQPTSSGQKSSADHVRCCGFCRGLTIMPQERWRNLQLRCR